jgi:hypothetical protein
MQLQPQDWASQKATSKNRIQLDFRKEIISTALQAGMGFIRPFLSGSSMGMGRYKVSNKTAVYI